MAATNPPGTLGLDQAAQLLRLSPIDLTRLTGEGVLPRVAPGAYHPGAIIGAYIEHLRAEPDRRRKAPTQPEIAAHLDISDRRLRELLAEWGIDHKTTPLDDLRLRYIRKLREEAAGRASADGELDLVQERAALAREQRIRLEMANGITRGEFAQIELLGDCLSKAIEVMCAELDQIDGLISQTAPDLPESTRTAVLNCVAAARNKIATRGASLVITALDLGDDIDAELDA